MNIFSYFCKWWDSFAIRYKFLFSYHMDLLSPKKPQHPNNPKHFWIFTVNCWLYSWKEKLIILTIFASNLLLANSCHCSAIPFTICMLFVSKYLKAKSRTSVLRKYKGRKWICYRVKQQYLYKMNMCLQKKYSLVPVLLTRSFKKSH